MQRRLTSILAADVAGFSRLIGVDEEGTLALQRSYRAEIIDPAIEQHNGRIANTAGDSLLIEFESAVEAVRCAQVIQAGVEDRNTDISEDLQILYRIGINVGDVVAEGDDLLGDGVNVAARIEALAPPGGILLSRSARDQVRDRLNLNLIDLGEVQVKNITRPLRIFQILEADAEPVTLAQPRSLRRNILVAAVLLVSLTFAGGYYWFDQQNTATEEESTTALSLPDKPSIVVLPFTNVSKDQEQDYLIDGFTKAVNTSLSKFPQLFVIADTTAATYRGKTVRARDIGRDLGVRYLLEGSAQHSANGITINAHLIDTGDERTIWAEQYDLSADDPFTAQNKLIEQIAGTLRFALEEQAIAKVQRRSAENPKAYDLYLRALAASRSLNTNGRVESIRLLKMAEELEPDFLDAQFELSGRYLALWRFGGADDAEEALRLARHHAALALQIDRSDYRGHFQSGMLSLFADHHHELAYESFKRALEDNANDVNLLYNMGFLRSLMGEGADAIAWNNKAKRINPRYPGWYNFNAALSHFWIKDYEQAILLARTGMAAYPKSLAPRRILIATLVEMGRMSEAREEATAFLKINPKFRLSTFRNTPFQKSADQERYFGAMRKGGIPD